jgi:hypothetical protein
LAKAGWHPTIPAEDAMMPYQSYQLWSVERHKTIEEQHAADVRLGETAAALSGVRASARRRVRGLWPLRPRQASARQAPASQHPCAGPADRLPEVPATISSCA